MSPDENPPPEIKPPRPRYFLGQKRPPAKLQFSLFEMMLLVLYGGFACVLIDLASGPNAPRVIKGCVILTALVFTFIGWFVGLRYCADKGYDEKPKRAAVLAVFVV